MSERERIARIMWETWVREADAGPISWEDAPLYAPEDARCVLACADAILARPEPSEAVVDAVARAIYRRTEVYPEYALAQMNGILAEDLARAAIAAYEGDRGK